MGSRAPYRLKPGLRTEARVFVPGIIMSSKIFGLPNSLRSASGELLDLGGHHEITFGEPIDFVRPERDLDLAPGEVDVGMMIGRFGEFTNVIRKSQRFPKSFKR